MTPEEIIQNNLYNNEHIYLLSKSDIKVEKKTRIGCGAPIFILLSIPFFFFAEVIAVGCVLLVIAVFAVFIANSRDEDKVESENNYAAAAVTNYRVIWWVPRTEGSDFKGNKCPRGLYSINMRDIVACGDNDYGHIWIRKYGYKNVTFISSITDPGKFARKVMEVNHSLYG